MKLVCLLHNNQKKASNKVSSALNETVLVEPPEKK